MDSNFSDSIDPSDIHSKLLISNISSISSSRASSSSNRTFKLSDHSEMILKQLDLTSDMLGSVSREEESFISQDSNLAKSAQKEFSKKEKLSTILEHLEEGSSLDEIASQFDDPSDISLIFDNLKKIQEFEKELKESKSSKKLNTESSIKQAVSEPVNTSSDMNSQKKPKNMPLSQLDNSKQAQQKIIKNIEQEVNSKAKSNDYSDDKSNKNKLHKDYYDDVDDYDELVVNFGSKVRGLTFKDILKNCKKYESWIRWLKFERHKATSNPELAEKAYRYFSQKVPNWSELKAFC